MDSAPTSTALSRQTMTSSQQQPSARPSVLTDLQLQSIAVATARNVLSGQAQLPLASQGLSRASSGIILPGSQLSVTPLPARISPSVAPRIPSVSSAPVLRPKATSAYRATGFASAPAISLGLPPRQGQIVTISSVRGQTATALRPQIVSQAPQQLTIGRPQLQVSAAALQSQHLQQAFNQSIISNQCRASTIVTGNYLNSSANRAPSSGSSNSPLSSSIFGPPADQQLSALISKESSNLANFLGSSLYSLGVGFQPSPRPATPPYLASNVDLQQQALEQLLGNRFLNSFQNQANPVPSIASLNSAIQQQQQANSNQLASQLNSLANYQGLVGARLPQAQFNLQQLSRNIASGANLLQQQQQQQQQHQQQLYGSSQLTGPAPRSPMHALSGSPRPEGGLNLPPSPRPGILRRKPGVAALGPFAVERGGGQSPGLGSVQLAAQRRLFGEGNPPLIALPARVGGGQTFVPVPSGELLTSAGALKQEIKSERHSSSTSTAEDDSSQCSQASTETNFVMVARNVHAPELIEPPEMAASNDSSCTTVSALSDAVAEGGVNSPNASPRKRPRKQQLPASKKRTRTSGACSAGSSSGPLDSQARSGLTNSSSSVPADPGPRPTPGPSSNKKLDPSSEASRQQKLKESQVVSDFVAAGKLEEKAKVKGAGKLGQSFYEGRPRFSLLAGYEVDWNPCERHFQRYEDVKRRPEKRPSIADLSNQRHVLQKIKGWKFYLIDEHCQRMDEMEQVNLQDLEDVFSGVSDVLRAESRPEGSSSSSSTLTKSAQFEQLEELFLCNIQRAKAVSEQLNESRDQLMNILEHKSAVQEILEKFSNSARQRGNRRKQRLQA